MAGEQRIFSVSEIYEMIKSGKLFGVESRRELGWNVEQKKLLIDSILKGKYIGEMVLSKPEGKDGFAVVDGRKRLRTVYDFIENGFKTDECGKSLDGCEKEAFLSNGLSFYIVSDASDVERMTDVLKMIKLYGDEALAEESAKTRAERFLELALKEAKVETARYEFKQGFLRLSDGRKPEEHVKEQILETLCGMANSSPSKPCYIFIGVADKDSDALRVAEMDGIEPQRIADHYVVGIDREAKLMGITIEKYCRKIKDLIDTPRLSRPLTLSVLSDMEIINYKGCSVICLEVAPQREVSFLDGRIFARKHSNTVQITEPREIVALANGFMR